MESECALTTNGMAAEHTSLSSLTDIFFNAAQYRQPDTTESLLQLWQLAVKEDPLLAAQLLLWLRDARGGAGERSAFRAILGALMKEPGQFKHNTIVKILKYIPEIGRYDDLLVGLNTVSFRHVVVMMVNKALREETADASEKRLCAKWMPRIGKNALILAKCLGLKPNEYRHLIVDLSHTVETDMSARKWGAINYSHVPSIAAARYQKAFKKHDVERYEAYKEALVKGTDGAKINAAAIYPYQIVLSLEKGDKDIADQQWKALPDYMVGVEEHSILPMVDVSGSMGAALPGSNSVTCMDVAVSLGIYMAERCGGNFLTFSATPTLEKLTGETLAERVNHMRGCPWGMNTNLEAAFTLLLHKWEMKELKQMPKKIVILSDMQYDAATGRNVRAIDMIQDKFEQNGLVTPTVVFWNLAPYNMDNCPVTVNDTGVCLISGFSPAIMKAVLANKESLITPTSLMIDAISNPRYDIFDSTDF